MIFEFMETELYHLTLFSKGVPHGEGNVKYLSQHGVTVSTIILPIGAAREPDVSGY
jgi:hypothetical protein